MDPPLYRSLVVERLRRADELEVCWQRGVPPLDLRPEHLRAVDVLLTREEGDADCLAGAAGTVLRGAPEVPTVVIIARSNAQTVRILLDAGARGLLDERCPQADVPTAIVAAGTGGVYMCPWTAALAIGTGRQPKSNEGGECLFQSLTAREREILMLLRFGVRRREIADRLGISVRTYDVHRRRILEKLDIDRVEDMDGSSQA
jgi:DNA-binding NarL/FixJ family response regulator